jgi:putative transposase
MDEFGSLSHSAWTCKYHVMVIPKCRRRSLYGQLRQHLGKVFRTLAAQKESRIDVGRLMPNQVDMLIPISPKHAVSQVIGFITGASAIHLAQVYSERKRSVVGQHFGRAATQFLR